MSQTYSIAYSKQTGLLLACEPTGVCMDTTVLLNCQNSGSEIPGRDAYIVEDGLLLSDEEDGDIRYTLCVNDRVKLQDIDGTEYFFAVRACSLE